ncbi:hypothetical protein [Streptomyces sp. NPDC048172]|uniref:hypothetical protein n=1 Tax=Streptomyces sp. NPDC048172 TaxID=3365505 RepID=UPI0037186E6B
MAEQSRIDLSRLSESELDGIRNDVLRTLAERARGGGVESILYDRHGSGHSKNTDPRKPQD